MRQERGAKTSECFLNPSPGKHCWTVFFFPCSYQTVSLIYSHPNKHSAAAASCAFRVGTSGKKGPGISPGYLASFEGASPPPPPRLQSDVWATKWLIRILIPVRHYSAQTTRSLNRLAAERLGRPRSNGRGGGGLARLLVLKGDDFSSPWLRGHGFIYYTYVATNM